ILPFCDTYTIIQGIQRGVEGFVLNQVSSERFLQLIREVYNNQYVISGEIAKVIINHIRICNLDEKETMGKKLKERGITIKCRDLDFFFLLFKEKSNKEIAKQLQLSERTVKDYVSRVYRKIGNNERKKVTLFLKEVMASEV